MLVNAAGTRSGDVAEDSAAAFQDDPEFAEFVRDLVHGDAPRVFAILHEYGHREDAWIAAWGIAFDDHVEVIDADRQCRMSLSSAERARAALAVDEGATAHLYWLDAPASPLSRRAPR